MRTPFLDLLRRARAARGRVALARAVVGVWLAIHAAVAFAAPVAEAIAGGHAESVVAHWEDASDTSCPPQHDPATCQVCQIVPAQVGDGATGRVAPVEFRRTIDLPPRAEGLAACAVVLDGTPPPRGPPTA